MVLALEESYVIRFFFFSFSFLEYLEGWLVVKEEMSGFGLSLLSNPCEFPLPLPGSRHPSFSSRQRHYYRSHHFHLLPLPRSNRQYNHLRYRLPKQNVSEPGCLPVPSGQCHSILPLSRSLETRGMR